MHVPPPPPPPPPSPPPPSATAAGQVEVETSLATALRALDACARSVAAAVETPRLQPPPRLAAERLQRAEPSLAAELHELRQRAVDPAAASGAPPPHLAAGGSPPPVSRAFAAAAAAAAVAAEEAEAVTDALLRRLPLREA